MPKTTVSCPRCKSPVIADVQRVFDVNTDPTAKQKILSGVGNVMHCPSCGYEGPVNTPIVYHDPEKELLMTFFPPDLGLPVNEQERQIGPMINKIMEELPPEKRKGYLLRPQTMLTMQAMIEKILEGEGISKEMLQAQQDRLKLLQRLVDKDESARIAIIKENENLIDQDFFAILSRIMESTIAQGDQTTSQRLAEVQQQLLNETKTGQEIKEQITETEEALKSLQEASKEGLTREKLLDLILNAPNKTRVQSLVNYARSGIDYTFFQLLSEKIDQAEGEKKNELTDLRETILSITKEIDERMHQQIQHTRQVLEKIVSSENIEKAIQENISEINELFVELLRAEIENARQNDNQERLSKLEKVFATLQALSPPPDELVLIEELLGKETEEDLKNAFEEHSDEITPEFLQMLNNLIVQTESQGQPEELQERLKQINRMALKFSMKNQLKT